MPLNKKISTDIKTCVEFSPKNGKLILINGRLETEIETIPRFNPCCIRDNKSGRLYADSDYFWQSGERPVLNGPPILESTKDGSCYALLRLKTKTMQIEYKYILPADEPDTLKEIITLVNRKKNYKDTSSFACGFSKKIHNGNNWFSDIKDTRLCEIPYRHNTETGELHDYTLPEFIQKEHWYSTDRRLGYRQKSPAAGSEAWAWYDGDNALLISKYNPDEMEWSLIEPVHKIDGKKQIKVMRFGGAGRWKMGDPESAIRLSPQSKFVFGETRYRIIDGNWKQAYMDYRLYTESRGHKFPPNYNPPVHWNEIYDNPYWWSIDLSDDNWHLEFPEELNKMYTFKDIEKEAEKAYELGCECLYLDPGWDTNFGSNIWDEGRLGAQKDFAEWLKKKYRMKLALHTPLAPWSCNKTYPPEARRMDEDGNICDNLCVASTQYIDVKVERLKSLCKNGAYFLMFDGSWFEGSCWHTKHGHSVPSTHREHTDAILLIAQKVHKEYPGVVIEQHDPMIGPGTPRYAPTYFMHGKPGAFNELWGFEYMVDPMSDIISRRALSLYYLNMAYSIPVYLHIDLRKDNANAMMFWWYASTCRHLGIGGKHEDPLIWEAHRNAMKVYLENKRFFAQGEFFGIDETVHAHTLRDTGECVINCFNLDDEATHKKVCFTLEDIGIAGINKELITIGLAIQGKGHRMIKLKSNGTAIQQLKKIF